MKVEIIADSKSENNHRITTIRAVIPNLVLIELLKHKELSIAIKEDSFQENLDQVQNNPFVPIAWMKDHKGMQGIEYFNGDGKSEVLTNDWLKAKDNALEQAILMNEAGLTKQLVNRLLEPFIWHIVLITATEWENFFHLRCPQYSHGQEINDKTIWYRSWKDLIKDSYKRNSNYGESVVNSMAKYEVGDTNRLRLNKGQADIHMMALAEAMWDAYNESTPKQLKAGEWHIPFGDNISAEATKWTSDRSEQVKMLGRDITDLFVKVATARCARTSYTVVGEEGKEHDYEVDIKNHDQLIATNNLDAFEHCVRVMNNEEYVENVCGEYKGYYDGEMKFRGWSNNFRGFIQYRKILLNDSK